MKISRPLKKPNLLRCCEKFKLLCETLGTFLTNWTILLQYFYGLMPLQQLMRKHPSDARSLPAGITASAVSHSIRRFRVKIERDRSLLKKIDKTGERLAT